MARRLPLLVLLALAAVLLAAPAASAAWTAAAAGASSTAKAGSLSAPGSMTAVPNAGCTNVALSWPGVSDATSYRVEYRNQLDPVSRVLNSGWTVLTTTSSESTSDTSNTHLNMSVTYRVTALVGSAWESAQVESAAVNCGIGPVVDLEVSNSCTNNVLTWTKPYNTSNAYKVEYQLNGSATWTSLGNNVAATVVGTKSYINSAALTPTLTKGTTYRYRVTPTSGTGSISNVTAVQAWDNFHVESVTLANGATLGTLASGDSVVVNFSKPVEMNGGSVNNMAVSGRRNLFIANTGTTVNNGIGRVTHGSNIFANITSNLGGTGTWSTNGAVADARLTWVSNGTSSGGTLTQSGSLGGTFTAGTTVARCDPNPPSLPAATLPMVNLSAGPTGGATTISGRW